jgi:hypothetical protein
LLLLIFGDRNLRVPSAFRGVYLVLTYPSSPVFHIIKILLVNTTSPVRLPCQGDQIGRNFAILGDIFWRWAKFKQRKKSPEIRLDKATIWVQKMQFLTFKKS